MSDLKYFLAFHQLPGFGSAKFKRLLEARGSIEDAWSSNLPDLMSAGWNESEAGELIIARSEISPDEELDKLYRAGIEAVTLGSDLYPRYLKEIFNPPPILYYRGDIKCLHRACLAVVGARRHTDYGARAVEKILAPLATGLTIVSGLALGIDALAHQTALSNGGLTAAVLGSDLSWTNIGPKANLKLAEDILANNGCIISDFPLGTAANRTTFPQRNRLVSGLSRGTLVIEADENSGSLITANFAVEQNRDVFAVPGNIFSPLSSGTNQLIKKGAKPVTKAEDILDELSWQQLSLNLEQKATPIDLSSEEQSLLTYLCAEPITLDKLAEVTHTKINTLSSILMILEIKGAIRNVGGGYIKLT